MAIADSYERIVTDDEVGEPICHRYLYVLARRKCDDLNQGDPMTRPIEYKPKKATVGWEVVAYQCVLVPK